MEAKMGIYPATLLDKELNLRPESLSSRADPFPNPPEENQSWQGDPRPKTSDFGARMLRCSSCLFVRGAPAQPINNPSEAQECSIVSQSPPSGLVETFYAKLLSDYEDDASNTLLEPVPLRLMQLQLRISVGVFYKVTSVRPRSVKIPFLELCRSVASSIPEAKRVVITDLKGQFSNMLLTLESFEREQSRLSELVDGHTRILARIREKNAKSQELQARKQSLLSEQKAL